uniref:Uncharacterized protein n=1 Tax=Rubinisphaera brasiliensis (strain ATCC 49424 / DSM 5305 / JCM 21570 / IAM 15109 / NBRC 103401 / IFAM 1448) TaxID=756272 RepID=F0STB8_RUBBR|nr:hypothetical protein Plabr_2781 [Rubinisphaera brasiliensis DSM 5305]
MELSPFHSFASRLVAVLRDLLLARTRFHRVPPFRQDRANHHPDGLGSNVATCLIASTSNNALLRDRRWRILPRFDGLIAFVPSMCYPCMIPDV